MLRSLFKEWISTFLFSSLVLYFKSILSSILQYYTLKLHLNESLLWFLLYRYLIILLLIINDLSWIFYEPLLTLCSLSLRLILNNIYIQILWFRIDKVTWNIRWFDRKFKTINFTYVWFFIYVKTAQCLIHIFYNISFYIISNHVLDIIKNEASYNNILFSFFSIIIIATFF